MKQIQSEWTTSQLQRVTGVSRAVIEQRLAAIKPVRETGRERLYSAPECFRAIIRMRREDPAVERLNRAKAELAELNINKEREQLLERNAVEAVWTARNISIRNIVTNSTLSKTAQDEILYDLEHGKIEDCFNGRKGK
ncbi:MAG TPA: hypothetical protein VIK28_09660 [Sedimentisphaerales bacterium]